MSTRQGGGPTDTVSAARRRNAANTWLPTARGATTLNSRSAETRKPALSAVANAAVSASSLDWP